MGPAIKKIPRLPIESSPIIHTIRTAPYFASIIRALHIEVGDNMDIDRNVAI